MTKKILITAFEPFGLTGAFLRKANASLDVMTRLQAALPEDQYDFLTLPVADDAADLLRDHLDRTQPEGVLCLGELLTLKPGSVNLEPYAHDLGATLNPLAPLMGAEILKSAFAESAAPMKKMTSTIGAYHCNNIYKTALQWSGANQDVPAAFMHVAVLGDRDRQSAAVLETVQAMRDSVQPPQPRPAAMIL